MIKISNSLITIFFLQLSCTKSNDAPLVYECECEQESIINAELFENGKTDFIIVSNPEIEANCLRIFLSAIDCDGNYWQGGLVD